MEAAGVRGVQTWGCYSQDSHAKSELERVSGAKVSDNSTQSPSDSFDAHF